MKTNVRTVLAFEQYGELKAYHYNGDVKQAKVSLKRNCGNVSITKEITKTSCGFLPCGNGHITNYEERYFN